MLIEVSTGIMAMVGYTPILKVECYEKSCKNCAVRFKCYTSRDGKLEIGLDEWFSINKVIEHKIII
jgi:hypothetical protein